LPESGHGARAASSDRGMRVGFLIALTRSTITEEAVGLGGSGRRASGLAVVRRVGSG